MKPTAYDMLDTMIMLDEGMVIGCYELYKSHESQTEIWTYSYSIAKTFEWIFDSLSNEYLDKMLLKENK